MKTLKIFFVCWVTLALLLGGFFAQPALAQTGDCNNNGVTDGADIPCLINYLLIGGPAPDIPFNCDVDGTPGVNLGDLQQLIGHLYNGQDLITYTGQSPSFSNIKFTFPVITPGDAGTTFDGTVDLIDNPETDLMGIVITFSYQHEPGHVAVDLNNVDFTGTIVPEEWETVAYIDEPNNKAFLRLRADHPDDPPLAAGETGLIATLNFTRVQNGDVTFMSYTVFPHPGGEDPKATHSPMLITDYYADGTPPAERMLIPRYVLGRNGDVNLDGRIDAADIVFLINFLFVNGPPPGVW